MNKIYGAILSPYVRKVLFVLAHKNVTHELIPIMPFKTPSDYSAIHPLKKVPCFQDEYVTLPDSSIICGYLDDKYPQSSVYPQDFRERARAKWFEEYADTEIADLMLTYQFERVVKPTLKGGVADEALIKRKTRKKADEICHYIESELHSGDFLFAGGVSIADVAVGGMFLTGAYGGFEVCERSYPKLHAYLQRVWQLPELKELRVAERKMLEAIYKRWPEANVAVDLELGH